MPIYVLLAAVAVASAIPLLWLSLAGDRVPRARIKDDLAAGLAPVDDARRLARQSALTRRTESLVATLAGWGRRLTASGLAESVDDVLQRASMTIPAERVLAGKVALAVSGAVAGVTWMVISPSLLAFAVVVLATLAGWVAPDVYIRSRAQQRQIALVRELPDNLDQVAVCVEAGLGFEAALARVSAAGRGPLTEELQRLLQDVRIGLPRAEALQNLATRSGRPEVRQFTHAVNQAETYGLPVAQVLRTQADDLRERRRQGAEERAMKVPVKLTFPLVLCILPATMIVIIGPAAMRAAQILK